jgi:DNA ligase 1
MQLFGKPFKPLLAAKGSIMMVEFPAAVSPKIDGLRCITTPAGPVSRTLKPIRNKEINAVLSTIKQYLDGELVAAGGNFQQSTTAVMKADSTAEWEYHIFDILDPSFDEPLPFSERYRQLEQLFESGKLPAQCRLVPNDYIYTQDALEELHQEHMAAGFEGSMVRAPKGTYKFGRSTEKEGTLLKLKQFSDAEATIIGFEELMHNDNEAITNALGHTERSSHKENKRPSGMLGAFVLRSHENPDITFRCGTGLTEQQRHDYWQNKDELLGQLLKYKFFDFGIKDAPRHPVVLGIRHPDDI